ncbi:MAG: prephenate dehydratase [Aquisalinus sp.]|nr:prephenate dehydratase [Aquisalinus sp.]
MTAKLIAFQGERGAFSEVACRLYAPDHEPFPCATFEAVFDAVESGRAALAMVPVENSIAGRVSDIHHLLPQTSLQIVEERFLPVHHQLMTIKDAVPAKIKTVRSHAMALGQCRNLIQRRGLVPEIAGDTAGAARQLSETREADVAVIASELAAENYGLEIIEANIEDAGHNTTRFLKMAADTEYPGVEAERVITSFVFQVRNIPAALFKALGGFATNGVNMTKLESYQQDGRFEATMFYADIDGHPQSENVRLALEELGFFSTSLKILGVYEADPFRG